MCWRKDCKYLFLDLNEWQDSDGDGVGDNSDYYPYDENRWEREWPFVELMLISILFGTIYFSTKRDRDS